MAVEDNFPYDVLIDANLGKLARHLRFYGISVFFNKEMDHISLEKIANDHNINLLTTAKIHRMKDYCLQIPVKFRTDLILQLNYISKNFHFDRLFDLDKTRCGLCNTLLSEIIDENKINNLPIKTKEFYFETSKNKKIWYCSKCKKYYWEGTHWKQITSKIKDL
ncbi:MAG: Mut7-C RNAse domain-containing protein [Candidatus Hodarchaeales archaeon]